MSHIARPLVPAASLLCVPLMVCTHRLRIAQARDRPPLKRALTIEDEDEIATRERLTSDYFEAIANDEADEVQELIEAGAEVDCVDGSGRSGLMKAAAHGSTEVAAKLIELGANVALRDVGGWTALLWACEQDDDTLGQEVAATLHAAADPGLIDAADLYGTTALMRAATLGRSTLALWLLGAGADATLKDERGACAVACALHAGESALAQELLEQGAYCDLASACALGAMAAVAALVPSAGAALDALDQISGCTPLMVAATRGDAALVELL